MAAQGRCKSEFFANLTSPPCKPVKIVVGWRTGPEQSWERCDLAPPILPTVHHKSRKPERKPSIPTISQALGPRICVTKDIKKEARFLFLPIISHPHRLCGRAAATQIRFVHGYLCRAATPHGFLKELVASYKGRKDQLPVMIAVRKLGRK